MLSQLASCSSNQANNDLKTISDGVAKEKQILSEDDAEVLVYNELTEEEKERYTVDYMKEEEQHTSFEFMKLMMGKLKFELTIL